MPVLLLLLLALAFSFGAAMVVLVVRRSSRHRAVCRGPNLAIQPSSPLVTYQNFLPRPSCWLAIRSRNLQSVQSVLNLHNPKPCSWSQGLAGDEKLFIAPPVKGWVLIFGSGLPEPSDDVDACFRFVTGLSRKLGHVQFFSASRLLNHHAWVRVEAGRVVRAYAWAGKTLWKQGRRTSAEKELGVACLDYCDAAERLPFTLPETIAANVDKVPLLAARWSLDPAAIDEALLAHACGVAGEPARRY